MKLHVSKQFFSQILVVSLRSDFLFGIHPRQINCGWFWHCHMKETTFDTRSCGFNPAMATLLRLLALDFGEVGRAAEVKMDTVLSEVEG